MRTSARIARIVVVGWAVALAGCQVPTQQVAPQAAGPTTKPVAAQTSGAARPTSSGSASVTQPAGEVAARVNGQAIMHAELVDTVLARHGREVLEGLIIYRLVSQAARRTDVGVTDAEVEKQVESVAQKRGLSADRIAQIMRTTRQDWHRRLWQQMVVYRIVEREVTVSDGDLRKAFDAKYGETMDAAWILCNNVHDAQKVWEELREKPAGFGRLAGEHSIDTSTRSLNGRFKSRVQRTMFSPEVEKSLFSLGEGQTSAVLQTRFGYAIFRCLKRHPAQKVAFEGVKEDLRKDVLKGKTRAAAKTFVTDLVRTAKIESPMYPDLGKRRVGAAGPGRPAVGPMSPMH